VKQTRRWRQFPTFSLDRIRLKGRRTLQDNRRTAEDTAGKLQHTKGFYAIDRPKLNNAQHKRINVFINVNGSSGCYVRGHDLYSPVRLLIRVIETIIAD